MSIRIDISTIELDTSIQCRASIDTAVVNEYAERMAEGDRFSPIEVFGTKSKCWIGDGWHRVLAARGTSAKSITANVHAGARVDALKHALNANSLHGIHRSNDDKRRCVEIALREFPKLSSRAVAALCGVSVDFAARLHQVSLNDTFQESVTGRDGKEYPARRDPAPSPPGLAPAPDYSGHATARATPTAPSNGMQLARIAVMKLEEIRDNDLERTQAFSHVRSWLDARET